MVFENSSKVSSAFLITTFFYQMYKKKKEPLNCTDKIYVNLRIGDKACLPLQSPYPSAVALTELLQGLPGKKKKNNNIHKNFNDFNDCYLEDLNLVANPAQGLPVLVPLLLKVFHLRKVDKIVSEILNCDKQALNNKPLKLAACCAPSSGLTVPPAITTGRKTIIPK